MLKLRAALRQVRKEAGIKYILCV